MAAVQPAITGRELNRQLAAHGLAFPVGHSPSVPLSGFLLNAVVWGGTSTDGERPVSASRPPESFWPMAALWSQTRSNTPTCCGRYAGLDQGSSA